MGAEVEVASENMILCWLKRNGGSGVGCAHVKEILENFENEKRVEGNVYKNVSSDYLLVVGLWL